MAVVERLTSIIRRRRESQQEEHALAERRAFLETDVAQRIPLREFEERFGITEFDGYTGSDYYRPEVDANERERQRKALDDFLTEK